MPTFATLMILVAGGVGACGSPEPVGVIDREAFIDTYVDLRIAALETDSGRIAEGDREAILAERGVSEQDLLDFAEAYGAELEFMRDVWNEVELRMDRTAEPADGSETVEPDDGSGTAEPDAADPG